MADIKKALPYVLANEGGAAYTNNPKDPGGPTKWGVTQKALAEWRHHPVSARDVQNLTEDEACAIYHAHYWDILNLDLINHQGVATAIFDISVNRGPGKAQRYVKMTVDELRPGAVWQIPKVINEIDPHLFIAQFERIAEAGYRAIVASKPSMIWALKGWINRARRMLRLG